MVLAVSIRVDSRNVNEQALMTVVVGDPPHREVAGEAGASRLPSLQEQRVRGLV